jgi:ADP-dependent NAD(P)H-hydrate dehydratase / NAD(P)H-hydrate epimerase
MKILSSKQIRELDTFTIATEPIASIDLMERAARAFSDLFSKDFKAAQKTIKIVCGLGNNGGDGLAIARMLHPIGFDLEVFVVKYSDKMSEDFQINLARLEKQLNVQIIDNEELIPNFTENDLIIDVLLGSGLNRPTEGLLKTIIQKINDCKASVVSVDIPSGLFADSPNSHEDVIIKADATISFQLPKLAFFLPQNAEFVGKWHVVKIGLNESFIEFCPTNYFYTENAENLIKPRSKFSNKGTFGHALLVVGSYGMMGAAVLSARACMRSGVGKLTVKVPKCGYEIMQIAIPEAMILTDENYENHSQPLDYQGFSSVGIGCGIGKNEATVAMLKSFLENCVKPIVLDADALNIIAENKFHALIPQKSILTPHPKEFERLIGKKWKNDYEKLDFLTQFAQNQQVTVCLKGANTAVALPDGTIHFNSTGNAGMAKAGSGDVLTGMITALLAQGYSPENAAILGVYLHGLSGDKAVSKRGINSMIASDTIDEIKF